MVDLVYNWLVLPLLQISIGIAQLVSPKLRERKRNLSLPSKTSTGQPSHPRLLFHAASMGELEQVIPLMNEIKKRWPMAHVTYSCTSPSGFHHARRQACIDQVVYLPIDTKQNAQRFISALQPDVVIINRYDVWPNTMRVASSHCPVLLINATHPSVADSPLLTSWVRDFYSLFSEIVAVSENDAGKLAQLTGKAINSLPDTRIDRVLERIQKPDSSVEYLRADTCITIVVGSSWPEDEELFVDFVKETGNDTIRLIIVPHEPTEQALQRIEQLLPCTRLSMASGDTSGHILVDSVGKLLALYSIADAAFVGGGFGAGVHSTTEAAAYGIPVACGPRIQRSRDATMLQQVGLVTSVSTCAELHKWAYEQVLDADARQRTRIVANDVFTQRSGSTIRYADIITRYIGQC